MPLAGRHPPEALLELAKFFRKMEAAARDPGGKADLLRLAAQLEAEARRLPPSP